MELIIFNILLQILQGSYKGANDTGKTEDKTNHVLNIPTQLEKDKVWYFYLKSKAFFLKMNNVLFPIHRFFSFFSENFPFKFYLYIYIYIYIYIYSCFKNEKKKYMYITIGENFCIYQIYIYIYNLLKKEMFWRLHIDTGANQHCLIVAQTGVLLLTCINIYIYIQCITKVSTPLTFL